MLPTFTLIGAMKAGTTSIAAALGRHPDVFMCTPKEPQFFTTRWERGLGWYESLFAAADGAAARGDGSTSYTDFPRKPEAAERMARTVPDVKLVYVVREPIARMRSHYRHRVADGLESRPIDVALRDDRYLLRSCYALQLEQYLRYFPAEQLLVVDAADVLAGGASWQRVFEFIGVPAPSATPEFAHANSGDRRLQLRPETRSLQQRLRRHRLYVMTPAPVRAIARRAGTRKPSANDAADISPELRADLLARLRTDMDRLGELTGLQLV